MRYKLLGKSGLRVSELCFGTMTFGEEWGWGANKDVSKKMYDLYRDKGGNFIDTANRYTEGTSEKFLADFIASDRDEIVLATKYTLHMRPDDPNGHGNHRKNMIESLNASLKRLKTDYIDLYWLHAWDFTTYPEEVMRALDDMIRAGKIHYIGISDTPAWIVSQCNTLADLRGWTSFVGLQIEYSLVQRTPERDLLPMAKSFGMALTPWGILGSGVLSGKYADSKKLDGVRLKEDSLRLSDRNLAIAAEVGKVAKEIGCSSTQVAINWVRKKYDNCIPILGATKVKQLEDNIDCLRYDLTAEQIASLDEVSKIELGFPHEFLNDDNIRQVLFGNNYDKIDGFRK